MRFKTLNFDLFDQPIASIGCKSAQAPPSRPPDADEVLDLLKGLQFVRFEL